MTKNYLNGSSNQNSFTSANPDLNILICTVVSLVITLYPILSIIIFRVVRKHVMNLVLLNVTASTFLYNLSFFLRQSIASECKARYVFRVYFNLTLFYWVSTLTYYTYKIFQMEKSEIKLKTFMIFSYLYPAITIGLLFITGKMETHDNCQIEPRSKQLTEAYMYMLVLFFAVPIVLLQSFNMYCTFKILVQYYVLKLLPPIMVLVIVSRLLIYVLIQDAFVILYMYLFIEMGGKLNSDNKFDGYSNTELLTFMANSLLGAFFGVIFFLTSKESRKGWKSLIFPNCANESDGGDERKNVNMQLLDNETIRDLQTSVVQSDHFSELGAYKSDEVDEDYGSFGNLSLLSEEDRSILDTATKLPIFGGISSSIQAGGRSNSRDGCELSNSHISSLSPQPEIGLVGTTSNTPFSLSLQGKTASRDIRTDPSNFHFNSTTPVNNPINNSSNSDSINNDKSSIHTSNTVP